MGLDVSTRILWALTTFYPTLPEPQYNRREKRFMKKKEKEEENNRDPLKEIILYGLKFEKELDKGITPGYHRPLVNKAEFLAALMYQNSHNFREAIAEIREEMKWLFCFEKQIKKAVNRELCEEMQHPEMRRTFVDEEDFEIECRFCKSEAYEERGKTYAWFLTQNYGGEKGFSNQTSYGKYQFCTEPLPVWRRCTDCANAYLSRRREDIYTICMECPRAEHQRSLHETTNCGFCWGPPELRLIFL